MSNFQPGQLAIEIDGDTADPVMSSTGGIEVVNDTGNSVVVFTGSGAQIAPGTLAVFIPVGGTGSIRAKPRREPVITFRQIGRSSIAPPTPVGPGIIVIDPGNDTSSPATPDADVVGGFNRVVVRQDRIVLSRNQNDFSLTFS